MELIQRQNGIHVYATLSQNGSPVLAFYNDWTGEEVNMGDFVSRILDSKDEDTLRTTVRIFGSTYKVLAKRQAGIEAITITPNHVASRPLGISGKGPTVNHLQWYRLPDQPWQILQPGEVPTPATVDTEVAA